MKLTYKLAALLIAFPHFSFAEKAASTPSASAKKFESLKALGTNSGGGGDDVALEFQQYVAEALNDMRTYSDMHKTLSDLDLLKTVSEAHIVMVDETLDIQTQDLIQNSAAANFPEENAILVNRSRWAAIKDVRMRKAISLHETLSLKRIEKTGYYPFSSKYLILVGGSASSLKLTLKANRPPQHQAMNSLVKNGTNVLRAQADGGCTTQPALDQAFVSIKTEIESDLAITAQQIHANLKQLVPANDFAEMQRYNRPLSTIKAMEIETELAFSLNAMAKVLDETSTCRRQERYDGREGVINWVCRGNTVELGLRANDGDGSFTVVLKRTGGSDLVAPISYIHSVHVEERYNKIETSVRLKQVLFPATQHGGSVVADDVKAENLDQLPQALIVRNQHLCNQKN